MFKQHTWDRTFAVIGVVTVGIGSKIGKAPKALAVLGDVIKASDKGEDAARALSKAESILTLRRILQKILAEKCLGRQLLRTLMVQ